MKAHRMILFAERARAGGGPRARAPACSHAAWAEDRDLTDDAVLRELAAAAALDADQALAATEDPGVRARCARTPTRRSGAARSARRRSSSASSCSAATTASTSSALHSAG